MPLFDAKLISKKQNNNKKTTTLDLGHWIFSDGYFFFLCLRKNGGFVAIPRVL